ncbi:hypothetical protein OESDEN_24325 [Oesophagostomum dentatum]|uniref:CHK kinase-like domain-containing protein n=1 Tax=Oesophagostomum dentatum TaxID=61180 RepID=A0A0B1RWP4_OESDE|nr:hypothetical protein OESDEN_24325 [Oesophagostomum dentatum]
MERVICHGDLWSANLLWRENGADDVHLAAIVDFQTANMGCPSGDLVRLFSTCLSGKERQRHWEELVEDFYGFLKEEVGDGKMPYTLEQLKESYKQFIPLGSFLAVAMIQAVYKTAYNNPNEEQKKKIVEDLTEKMECLLDDIIFYYKRNLKLRREKQSKKECKICDCIRNFFFSLLRWFYDGTPKGRTSEPYICIE